MRSLVITAAILFFNIVMSVLANVAPYIYGDTPVPVNVNQTIITNMTDQGHIVSSEDYQNTYYGNQISITNTLWNIITGTIFIGVPLMKMGMDSVLAVAINAILGVLVLFDLYTLWKGTPW
jgi:hypothetical protein